MVYFVLNLDLIFSGLSAYSVVNKSCICGGMVL
jgi:hypothetical protein